MVGTILMDNEFEKLRPLVPGLNINTTSDTCPKSSDASG